MKFCNVCVPVQVRAGVSVLRHHLPEQAVLGGESGAREHRGADWSQARLARGWSFHFLLIMLAWFPVIAVISSWFRRCTVALTRFQFWNKCYRHADKNNLERGATCGEVNATSVLKQLKTRRHSLSSRRFSWQIIRTLLSECWMGLTTCCSPCRSTAPVPPKQSQPGSQTRWLHRTGGLMLKSQ